MTEVRLPSYLVTRISFLSRGILLLLLCLGQSTRAQDTLRIGTYNLLNYPGSDASVRNPYFRTVIHTMKPDVLVVQEMTSQTGVNGFLSYVLNFYQSGLYSAAPFKDGPDTDNAFFYKSSRVTFLDTAFIGTALRDIAEYRFKLPGSSDTIRFYSLHLKASSGGANETLRLAEATILRNRLNTLPTGAKFIVGGDYNIYRSSEPAFQKLIGSEANNNGRCKDPLNAVGTWHDISAFRSIHTQSPRVRDFGGGSNGGMDDRFDILLISYSMDPSIILSSYTAYGNDGNHINDSINRLPNAAVSDSVANALHYAADHLPVFARFVFNSTPPTVVASVGDGLWNSPSTWNTSSVPSPVAEVLINTGHTVTIDGNVTCGKLTVQGTLQFDATSGRGLTIGGDFTIGTAAVVRASDAFTSGATTQSLTIGRSFFNHGTFTAAVFGSSSGSRVVNVTFNGPNSSVINGLTSPTTFNQLTMNLGTPAATLTPLVNLSFNNVANALTLTRGTWVQSASQTAVPYNNVTVDTNATLAISDAGIFSTGTSSLIVKGVLDVSSGTLTVGGGNNRLEVVSPGDARFEGGTVTINGRFTLSGGTTSISGGGIAVNPRGSSDLSGSSNVFEGAGAASILMTGGSLTIVNPRVATWSGREVKMIAGTGSKSFSGGTIYFGDGLSTVAGSDTGFAVESAVPLPDVVLRTMGTAGRDVSLASSLSVKSLTLESGTLRLANPFTPGYDLTIAGNLTRTSGGISVGTRTVTMTAPGAAAATSITGGFSSANGFRNLSITNVSGVRLNGHIQVEGTLNTSGCRLTTDTSVITLGSTANIIESVEKPIVGKVSTTRTVSQSVNETFGGIGIELNAAGAAPGLTTVLRQTGVASTGNGYESVLRYFDLVPATNAGLNATLVYRYDDTELNGHNAAILQLWQSTNGGALWISVGGSVDTAAKRISVSGLANLSRFTAADTLHPLFGSVSQRVPVTAGWNLVSVPRTAPDYARIALFPNSISSAYQFVAGDPPIGYVGRDTLANKIGYWLKFPLQDTVTIPGEARHRDTISVLAGWNLIGTCSDSIAAGSVVQSPPNIVTSPYFGFQGGYVGASTLAPGRSYWVKVSQSGTLILRSTVDVSTP